MKKIITLIAIFVAFVTTYAQQEHFTDEKSLAEEIGIIKKKQDKFNFFMNLRAGLDIKNYDGNAVRFKLHDMRIEAKGNVTPWLSYRWRHRLHRSNDQKDALDNSPTSIDIMGIGLKPIEKLSFFIGKQAASFGSYEYDLNPIDVYEYADIVDNMYPFLVGVNIAYQINDKHQLQLQVLNGRNYSFGTTYETPIEYYNEKYENPIKDTAAPLLTTINWNGEITKWWKTRWSYSLLNQAKGNLAHLFAIGNMFTAGDFEAYFDYIYSRESLDKKGILTREFGKEYSINADYQSFILHLSYTLKDKWRFFVKGMFETAGNYKDGQNLFSYKIEREAYGYIGGIEFYPMADRNLRIFATYIGRTFVKINPEVVYTPSNKVSLGFIYQLPMF